MAERSALVIQSGGFREISSTDTLLAGAGIKSETSGLLIDAQSGTLSLGTQSATTAIAIGRSGITSAVTGTFSVNNSNIGQSTTKKNIIINGNFDVWQRGTTFTSVVNDAYVADRFVWESSGAGVVDISREATIKPTVAESGLLSNYSLKIDVTTADASIGSGEYYAICQRIVGHNWQQIAQISFTLSFWVYSSQTGTYCIGFQNSGQNRSYVAEYTINSANTWEKKTINVSASPSAGTWNYRVGIGLRVYWTLAVGTTRQTTAGAWQTGEFLGTSSQTNWMTSASNLFYLSQIQIEAGDTATDFEIRDIGKELMLCQRYYWKTFPQATAPAQNAGTTGAYSFPQPVTGTSGAADRFVPGCNFPVIMNNTPTVTTYNPSAASAVPRNITAGVNYGGGIATSGSTTHSWSMQLNTPAAGTAGDHSMVHATADAEL